MIQLRQYFAREPEPPPRMSWRPIAAGLVLTLAGVAALLFVGWIGVLVGRLVFGVSG
jgi:hypothetical protein